MALYERHFTIGEAREWLPELRRRFERINALYGELQELREDHEKVVALIRSNGHAPKDPGFSGRLLELQSLVRDINDAGIEVKDVSRGLVDFPHMREGEEVYLCWEMEDSDLLFWHRIEDGYAGRTPL